MPSARQDASGAPRSSWSRRRPKMTRSSRTPPGASLNERSTPNERLSARTCSNIAPAPGGTSASLAWDVRRPAGVALSCASYSRKKAASAAASSLASAGRTTMQRSALSRLPKRSAVSSRVLLTWQTSARSPWMPGSIQRSGTCGLEERPPRQIDEDLLDRRAEQAPHLGFVLHRGLVLVALEHQLAARERPHERFG